MAHRRKRITVEQIDAFLKRLRDLPIEVSAQTPAEILELTTLARHHNLTVYDSAYLALAKQLSLPLATVDLDLRKAANALGLTLVGM
jgi:predicted nucleic acid-binding protein